MNAILVIYDDNDEAISGVCRWILFHGSEQGTLTEDVFNAMKIRMHNKAQDVVSDLSAFGKGNVRNPEEESLVFDWLVARDYNGMTCLHYAAMNGHTKQVRMLCNGGARQCIYKSSNVDVHDTVAKVQYKLIRSQHNDRKRQYQETNKTIYNSENENIVSIYKKKIGVENKHDSPLTTPIKNLEQVVESADKEIEDEDYKEQYVFLFRQRRRKKKC